MSRLIIICGISFAGKSSLAAAIAQRLGCIQVDVDNVKHRLFGPACVDENLTRAEWDEIYAEADRQIDRVLAEGKDVIDASRNFRSSERRTARDIAARQAAEIVTIFVDTPVEIARERLIENRLREIRRDVPDEDFNAIARLFESPGPDEAPLVIRPEDHVDQWISRNLPVRHGLQDN